MLVTDPANAHSPEGAGLNLLSRDDRMPNIMASIYLVALVNKPHLLQNSIIFGVRWLAPCSRLISFHMSATKGEQPSPVLISGSSAELRNSKSNDKTRHQNGHPLKRSVSCMDQTLHITSLCILSIQRIYGFGTIS
jgi:hypothetical protein